MNCIELFKIRAAEKKSTTALWFGPSQSTSFNELSALASHFQSELRKRKIEPGDAVLALAPFSAKLYGGVLGTLASGATLIFVEPWMAARNIEHVVSALKPQVFLYDSWAWLWGKRIRAIREIPHWISVRSIRTRSTPLETVSVNGDSRAIVTFTSGTTGKPKGVVRTQQYLLDIYPILARKVGDNEEGADLCVFANFALMNLAGGRPSLMVPSNWNRDFLASLSDLKELSPTTVTCGPAFLKTLLQKDPVRSLRQFQVGGALTDCKLFESGFKTYPDASWNHIYGSSEAEPVALIDARKAVSKSRAMGHFQTLCVGTPITEISHRMDEKGLWVSGPNVCPAYVLADTADQAGKKQDSSGKWWHSMGDRIRRDDENLWWYAGRSGQIAADFEMEQRLYSRIQSSESFIHRDEKGRVHWIGVDLDPDVREEFPQIDRLVPVAKIHRDPRHRARIDRLQTIRQEAKWLAG